MRSGSLLSCVMVSAAAACAALDTEPRPVPFERRVAGCYALDPGPWLGDSVLARFHPLSEVPGRFRLETSRFPGWEELQNDSLPMYSVSTGAAAGRRPFAFWSRSHSNTDTIHVGHPIALSGVSLRLWPRGRDLQGEITTFTDFIPEDGVAEATAAVFARRVDCSTL